MKRIEFSDTCNYDYDVKNSLVEGYLEPMFFFGRQFEVNKNYFGHEAVEIIKERNYLSTTLKVASYAFLIPLMAALIMKVHSRTGSEFLQTYITQPHWTIHYLDGTS